MISNRNFEQCQPLTWMGRTPVYLATAIAAVHGITMILTALGTTFWGAEFMASVFGFSAQSAISGLRFWQFITYAFVNPPDLMLLLQIIMLAMFGGEVEKFLGRKSFAWLYALLVIGTPVYLLVLSFFRIDIPFVGSGFVNFCVFLAFALIYPKAEIFFTIQARWIAIVLLAIPTLQLLASHNWPYLGLLWWECSVATAWLVTEGVRSLPMPSWAALRREHHSKKNLRVVKREPEEPESIDPILEKIARQGMSSLTRAERDQLERARTALLEKERSAR